MLPSVCNEKSMGVNIKLSIFDFSQNGWTALYIAAAKGYVEVANALFAFHQSPSDVNVRNTVSDCAKSSFYFMD